MTQFEFLAVFVSIIFGLSLTQILSGAIHLLQRRTLTSSHLGWTLFVLYVLVINWWTFWPWHSHEIWSFLEFSAVILWALTHYVMATALYPSRSLEGYNFDEERRSILWAFIAAGSLDAVQTTLRGGDGAAYYVFVGFMIGATAIGLLTRNSTAHRVIPWVLVISMLIWSFTARLYL